MASRFGGLQSREVISGRSLRISDLLVLLCSLYVIAVARKM